jgi:hypothetical protein
MPGLTDPGAHAVAIGALLALIIAGIGLAPLTAAVIGLVRRRRQATRPMPAIGDDGTPDRCDRCGGPLPALYARWWLSTDGGVHCSQACADGGDRG